jgi:hypothetical protein
MQDSEIRTKTAAVMPELLADLERLVGIPSVAFPGYHPNASAWVDPSVPPSPLGHLPVDCGMRRGGLPHPFGVILRS